MIYGQEFKVVDLQLGSVATNATATANIDTKGWKHCSVVVSCDTAAATSSNPAVLKLSQSDDTVVTNFADISGFVGDTDFTIPNAETTKTTNAFAVLNVNMEGKKRYVRFSCTPAGAAQIIHAQAILTNGDSGVANATEGGALVRVNG